VSTEAPSQIVRYRIRFAKRGDLRFLSHHDLLRCFERILRRAELPMATSHGFNPRPRIVFGLALGLGIESECELVDLELTESIDAEQLLLRLRQEAPAGLVFLNAEMTHDRRAPRILAAEYSLNLPMNLVEEGKRALVRFGDATDWPIVRQRHDREVKLDLKEQVLWSEIDSRGKLCFRLAVGAERSARPEELVTALGLKDADLRGIPIMRTSLILESSGYADPASPTSDPSACER
jgi:radical SAM-linked protein